MLDLRRLRVLRAIAYYGTVTAAAEALHMTPSAASQQVRLLGRELGVTLLEPRGRRVRLTPAAQGLLRYADTIEELWQRAEAELAAAKLGQTGGEVRVCGTTTAISALLVPVALELKKRQPEVRLSIREAEPEQCFDLVFSGAVDIGVAAASPDSPTSTDSRFDQRHLFDDPFELLTPPEHRLAGRRGVALADLAAEPWVLGMPGTSYHGMIMAVCHAAGFTPLVAHEVLEWSAVSTLVGHGLGISLVPRLARLPSLPAVVRTPLDMEPAPCRRLLAVIRRGDGGRPLVAETLALLRANLPVDR